MSNEEALQYIDEGMKALTCAMPKVKQALSSANIAVGQAEAYNQGLNDAWDCAKKCFANMKEWELEEVFGKDWTFYKIMELTPQEALAKLEAYEKEQNEIKVGDEIIVVGNGVKGYVIDESKKCEDCYVALITNYKDLHTAIYNKSVIQKTGKHIDIQSVLAQIGGGSDEW